MIGRGLRRLLVVFGLAVGLTGALSLLFGLVSGSAPQRSLSVGYMLIGSLVMVVGLGAGLRGWSPTREEGEVSSSGGERIAASAVLIGIGAALVLLGIGLDPRTTLV